MKVKRNSIHRDPCIKSINSLYERVENYFIRNIQFKSTQRFYVDHSSSIEFDINTEEVVDIIFFGDCVKKFFESGNWNFSQFRFWVLSSSNKEILENLLGTLEVVNLIPRDEIFDMTESRSIIWNEKIELVFAGRLSAQKNITALVSVLSSLRELGIDCSLHLFGSYDDTYHEDYGRRENDCYKNILVNYIKHLSMSDFVKFYGEVSEDIWINSEFSNPVYISLSTFICEDFGCSAALAQQKGWPLIISDWGGHRDIFGKGVYKVPSSLIAHSHLPREIVSLMGIRAATYLLECKQSTYSRPQDKLHLDKVLTLELVDIARRSIVKSLGASSLLLNREFLSHFADTISGTIFLDKIRSFMSSSHRKMCIISQDFDIGEENICESLQTALRNDEIENVNLYYISSKNIFDKDSLKRILQSERIYLNKFKESDEIYSYIVEKLKIDVSCIYYE